MTRHYSPKSFLRQVPNQLLKEFFDRRRQLGDILWYNLRETEVELVYNAWQRLPTAQREAAEAIFRAVHEMACEGGIRALVEEGHFHQVDLATDLEGRDGLHHKAMWAYLRHERVFEVASLLHWADTLNRRYWVRRRHLPRQAPDVSREGRLRLADALSAYLRREQGRGHHCTVEPYLRCGRFHYVFAYPDDYAETYVGHGADGNFIRRAQRRAFEIIFVYDPREGALDLYAQGEPRTKADFQHIFCKAMLGVEVYPDAACDPVYELNHLRSRDFPFATDPADGIEEVRVRKMRLSVGAGGRRIILEANPRGDRLDLYDFMDEWLNGDRLRHEAVQVTQVEIQFRLAPVGHGRPRTLTFEVSYPHSSNLKSFPERERLLGEKYLKRWGIERE
jgi:hypothetical protein